MRELRTLREGWEMVEAEESRLLRGMTIQESVRLWLMLQRSFEAQLQQTAAIFGPERQTALAQFQASHGPAGRAITPGATSCP